MRAEHRLSDNVNVELRAQRARDRVSSNGGLQGINHVEFPSIPPIPKWYDKLFPHQEHLIVGGREVKGFVVPTWAAGVLLAAILGSMGFMYSRLSDQRDMLIRLDTQLQERDKHEMEYREEFKTKLNVQALQIENITGELRAVRAILTPQQLRAVQRAPKGDNSHARRWTRLPRMREGNS